MMQNESRAAYLARKHHEEHWGKAPATVTEPKLSRAAQLAQKYQEDHHGKKPTEAENAIAVAAAIMNAIDL